MDDLAKLSRDLEDAADNIPEEAAKVVGQGCLNIKNATQRTWRNKLRDGQLRHLWRSVSYDVTEPAGGDIILGEVGPVLSRKQGPLGHIAEDGLPDQPPAAPALGPAHIEESPRFEDHLGRVGHRLLDG